MPPRPQSSAISGAACQALLTPSHGSPITLHESPHTSTSSGQPAITFVAPTIQRTRKSVKRRPPTPGGPSAVNAFQKAAGSQFLHGQSQPVIPGHSVSSSTGISSTAYRLPRTSPASGLTLRASPQNAGEVVLSPSPPEIISPQEQTEEITRPHRRVPSRLDLTSISNHTTTLPLINDAELSQPSPPPVKAEPCPASPSFHAQLIGHKSASEFRPESVSASRSSHEGSSEVAHHEAKAGGSTSVAHPQQRRGVVDKDGPLDRTSVTPSANLDSPSTKAMMERLLSAPDYFTLHDPAYVDDDDNDSSGSLKFARADDEDGRHNRIREQRERSKIRKLLGGNMDDDAEVFSPRRVEGFSSDSDIRHGAAAAWKQRSTGIVAPPSPSGKRKQSMPSSYRSLEPGSPKNPGPWSSVVIPSVVGRPNDEYGSREPHLLPRVSQDSRQFHSMSTEPCPHSPPASPRGHHASLFNSRPKVPALETLHPQVATVKRSKTMSGAINISHSQSEELLLPPPRVSSKNALKSPKDTAGEHVGKGVDLDARTRVSTSKSAKSLLVSKSEPCHPPTPAGVIVEEYKRQIQDTRKASSSTKESRRLSALQWMIEQTKSVARSKSASATVPASPRGLNQCMSPPVSANLYRPLAPARTRTGSSPNTTATPDHPLSPGLLECGVLSQPLPSPLSGVSTNNSSTSLLSPEARFGRPAPIYAGGRGGQGSRGEALSPVLASAGIVPPDSPMEGSSSFLVPGSPRSEGHHSSETGHYVPARSQGYWSSGETREKEKRGLVSGLGKKLSKKRLIKRKEGAGEPDGPDGTLRDRTRGRSGTRDGGTESDTLATRPTRRVLSVDRTQALRHRKSLRLSIDKFADDGAFPHPPPSYNRVTTSVHRSVSSPGESSSTPPKASRKEGRGGSHFWKLVKRIGSSGGLREKYQSGPLSAIPISPVSSHGNVAIPVSADVDGNQGLSRGGRSSVEQLTSATPSNPGTPAKTPASTPGLKHPPSSAGGHISYYSHLRQHNQNINTRSSTPASSDHASSSRVFQRTHSSRSSASSFVELDAPPPLPTHPPSAFLLQRFGSRSDNGHHSDGGHRSSLARAHSQRTRKSSNNTTKTQKEDDWMDPETLVPLSPPSLPTPPRRPKPAITTALGEARSKPEDVSDFECESPLIPVFIVDNAINQFKPRKRSNAAVEGRQTALADTSNTLQLEAFPAVPSSLPRSIPMPPPRPARDVRRPIPPQTSSSTQQDSGSSTESSPAPRGKLKKSNSKSKKDKLATGYPSKPPTSAFGPSSPGCAKNNDSTPSLTDLPSQHVLTASSSSSSPLVTSPSSQASNPRSPVADFVSVEFRERRSLQTNRGLSEREKAEKWNALLDKSDQAGGTLHLTLGLTPEHLESDRLTINSSISIDP